MAAWVNSNGSQSSSIARIISKIFGNKGMSIGVNGSTIKVDIYFDPSTKKIYRGGDNSTILEEGVWHHAAVTFNGSLADDSADNRRVKYYVDGARVLDSSIDKANDGDVTVIGTGALNLVYGARSDTTPVNFLNGKIAQAAIWDTLVLTDAEILAIFNDPDINLAVDSGNYASSTNLISYKRFDSDDDTTGGADGIIDHKDTDFSGTALNMDATNLDTDFPS